jgi:hypothetical protein
VVKRNYSLGDRGEVKGKKRGKAKEKREQYNTPQKPDQHIRW